MLCWNVYRRCSDVYEVTVSEYACASGQSVILTILNQSGIFQSLLMSSVFIIRYFPEFDHPF